MPLLFVTSSDAEVDPMVNSIRAIRKRTLAACSCYRALKCSLVQADNKYDGVAREALQVAILWTACRHCKEAT